MYGEEIDLSVLDVDTGGFRSSDFSDDGYEIPQNIPGTGRRNTASISLGRPLKPGGSNLLWKEKDETDHKSCLLSILERRRVIPAYHKP
jgi:hypothetical protein